MAYHSDQGADIYEGAAGLGEYGRLRAFNSGSLGEEENGSMYNGFEDGPLRTFRSGSLGNDYGHLRAFNSGSLGGCRSCSGLGAAASIVLDMRKPEVVIEIKTIMAILAGPLAASEPQAMLTSPIWGEESTNFAARLSIALSSTNPNLNTNEMWVAPQLYPTAVGVVTLMSLAGEVLNNDPTTASKFPNLIAFSAAIGATGDLATGLAATEVIPPKFKAGPDKMVMAIGAGVAGIALLWLLTRKKR